MIRRVAENQVAAEGFGWKTRTDVMVIDIRPGGLKVVSKATTSHGLAYVKSRSTTGHRINDKAPRRGEIM